MATAGCAQCTGAIKNTGIPTNDKPFGVVKGKGFMPILASDGTRNYIDPTSATLEADILLAVNNPDPTKRLYLFKYVTVSLSDTDAKFARGGFGMAYSAFPIKEPTKPPPIYTIGRFTHRDQQ